MSEQKFTPGPWVATAFGDVMPVGANHLVASCRGKSGLYRNWKADSHLIAAAPELLEALQETMFALSDAVSIIYPAGVSTEEFGEKVEAARKKFHAAIAKATGSQS